VPQFSQTSPPSPASPSGFVAVQEQPGGLYLVESYRMPRTDPVGQDVVTDAELDNVVADLVDRLATGSGPKEAA